MDDSQPGAMRPHDLSRPGTVLLVLMSNPPSTTSGDRTRRRVALLSELLGISATVTANLFSIATYRTGNIVEVGAEPDGWLEARPAISAAIEQCNAVLLAYGGQEPSGPARVHFRGQVAWAETLIEARDLPVWSVGGRPLHPSRWHRFTHAQYPGVLFHEALVRSVEKRPRDGWRRPTALSRAPVVRQRTRG